MLTSDINSSIILLKKKYLHCTDYAIYTIHLARCIAQSYSSNLLSAETTEYLRQQWTVTFENVI